jgi:hypothetical protein
VLSLAEHEARRAREAAVESAPDHDDADPA